MAWPAGAGGGAGRGLALGDVELEGDQVDAGDALGDGVLDLQPGVHLQEEEAAVVAGEELDGAGAGVADRGRGGRDRGGEQRSRIPATRSTSGAGASSMTFWWRRWIEHSRSPSAHTVPCASASTWTSTWRPVAR